MMPRWSREPSASRPTAGPWARHSSRRCACARSRTRHRVLRPVVALDVKPRCAPSSACSAAAFRARGGVDSTRRRQPADLRRSSLGPRLRGRPDRGPARRCVLRRRRAEWGALVVSASLIRHITEIRASGGAGSDARAARVVALSAATRPPEGRQSRPASPRCSSSLTAARLVSSKRRAATRRSSRVCCACGFAPCFQG